MDLNNSTELFDSGKILSDENSNTLNLNANKLKVTLIVIFIIN
jgi:hypothetical protein